MLFPWIGKVYDRDIASKNGDRYCRVVSIGLTKFGQTEYSQPRGKNLLYIVHTVYFWVLPPPEIFVPPTPGSLVTPLHGSYKQILLPLAPEYIGYVDAGIADNLFTARRPQIDFLDDRLFKYRINFKSLEITDDIGAICVSRPTNPTGNVLTDDEVRHLDRLGFGVGQEDAGGADELGSAGAGSVVAPSTASWPASPAWISRSRFCTATFFRYFLMNPVIRATGSLTIGELPDSFTTAAQPMGSPPSIE